VSAAKGGLGCSCSPENLGNVMWAVGIGTGCCDVALAVGGFARALGASEKHDARAVFMLGSLAFVLGDYVEVRELRRKGDRLRAKDTTDTAMSLGRFGIHDMKTSSFRALKSMDWRETNATPQKQVCLAGLWISSDASKEPSGIH
jgi:hypothetical protein